MSAGVADQAEAATYQGGDNIFVTLPAKEAEASEPRTEFFRNTLPQVHMPGVFW